LTSDQEDTEIKDASNTKANNYQTIKNNSAGLGTHIDSHRQTKVSFTSNRSSFSTDILEKEVMDLKKDTLATDDERCYNLIFSDGEEEFNKIGSINECRVELSSEYSNSCHLTENNFFKNSDILKNKNYNLDDNKDLLEDSEMALKMNDKKHYTSYADVNGDIETETNKKNVNFNNNSISANDKIQDLIVTFCYISFYKNRFFYIFITSKGPENQKSNIEDSLSNNEKSAEPFVLENDKIEIKKFYRKEINKNINESEPSKQIIDQSLAKNIVCDLNRLKYKDNSENGAMNNDLIESEVSNIFIKQNEFLTKERILENECDLNKNESKLSTKKLISNEVEMMMTEAVLEKNKNVENSQQNKSNLLNQINREIKVTLIEEITNDEQNKSDENDAVKSNKMGIMGYENQNSTCDLYKNRKKSIEDGKLILYFQKIIKI
jgi:hypothetical protein